MMYITKFIIIITIKYIYIVKNCKKKLQMHLWSSEVDKWMKSQKVYSTIKICYK